MNAVVLYDYGHNSLCGGHINSIEYFLTVYEYNKDFKFFIINGNENDKNVYLKLIKERYNLERLSGFQDNIVLISIGELLRLKFDVALVITTSTIEKTKGLLNAKKILVLSDLYLDNPKYFYRKDIYDVTYYGEMPFHYKDEQYTFKMLFDRYKSIGNVKDNILVHSPRNKDTQFLETLPIPKKPIIFRSLSHTENYFSQFSTFVYYHAHKWFDPTPRGMHESYFYGKDIMYFNNWKLKDGSYFRYKDLMENGLSGRFLNKDDEIVRRLI